MLIVTGGWSEDSNSIILLDSTEMLVEKVWTVVPAAVLPSVTQRSVAVNVNNMVFIFGRKTFLVNLLYCYCPGGLLLNSYQEILMLNTSLLAWDSAGTLLERRSAFAADLIEDITELCP